jgi:hypothetical protein
LIAKKLGDPKGPDEKKHALEMLEKHLRERFSTLRAGDFKESPHQETPFNSQS